MFLPYMPDVARCELSLRELNQMWQLIESSAKMNCPAEARLLLPAMVATRTGFAHLEQALIANLVQEKVNQVLANLGTQARYAIDILVRNLFERTADVGFLATDADLCTFVADFADDRDHGHDHHRASLDAARRRLAAYRDKYTVYDEILLLDTGGRVLVQADMTTPVARSLDPLLAATLAADGYVETFRSTDLRPAKSRALVYSHRMRDPRSGAVVGMLCLCFNFEQEMDAIFTAYRDPSHRANMLLLDADNRVVSSADPLWIPAGGIEQQDFVVHRVLVAVGGQALARGVERGMVGVVVVRHERAQVGVGGQEAHVGGALEQIAHQDVDRIAGLGAEIGQHVAHLFLHQVGDQCLFQVRETGARGHHGRQQQPCLGRAVHLGGRFDKLPHLIQFAQRQLAARNVRHVG